MSLFGINKVQTGDYPMDQEKYNSVEGEALFLRAYYHMKLLLNWEKIIIRDEYLTSEEQTHKALSTREAGWEFVCSELSAAGKILPLTRPSLQAGRVTSGCCLCLSRLGLLDAGLRTTGEENGVSH